MFGSRLPLVCAALIAFAQPVLAETISGSTDALNAFRAKNGVAAVVWNKKLQKAAQVHADDMVARGYFSHTSPTGSTLANRMRKARYRFCAAAENIALGQGSLAEVMQNWADSPGHRVNLLSAKVTEFGLAKAPNDTWVMVLGSRKC